MKKCPKQALQSSQGCMSQACQHNWQPWIPQNFSPTPVFPICPLLVVLNVTFWVIST